MKQSENIKRKQNLFYLALISLLFSLVGLIAYMLIDKDPPKKSVVKSKREVAMPSDSMNPQEILNNRVESEMQSMQTRFKTLESFILDAKEKEEIYQRENLSLRREIESLKKSLQEKDRLQSFEEKFAKKKYEENSSSQSIFSFSNATLPFTQEEEPRQGLVVKVVDAQKNMVKHVDKTIPPGTTVRAVMISSVDAPIGAYSSSDPQPIKLQILDDGHLPKNVRAKLKGGIIIGSAYGDLSSERLYIRIERLTQVKPSGDFIETAVTGFITGEDGKYGVRGTVVDKSSKLVKNAAISGVFSGINSYFQAYASSRWGCYGYPGCFPDDSCSNRDLAYGLASQGGTSGMESAFNTLTDYYIRRAEFIKPVLQVNAGRIVDITFTLSTDIGDIHACDKAEKIRNDSRSGFNQVKGSYRS